MDNKETHLKLDKTNVCLPSSSDIWRIERNHHISCPPLRPQLGWLPNRSGKLLRCATTQHSYSWISARSLSLSSSASLGCSGSAGGCLRSPRYRTPCYAGLILWATLPAPHVSGTSTGYIGIHEFAATWKQSVQKFHRL